MQERSYTPDEAFAYCQTVTNAHYENFPVASLFLPEEKRPYIQALYAFSRIADDMADESVLGGGERLMKLDDWELKLRECYEGRADHPVFIALSETVRRAEIPIGPLLDLLAAFRRDVNQNRYGTYAELLGYCTCSANPVGRLVLMIFGIRDEELYGLSDRICTGLQLANFWQDLSLDALKDRLYIPLEDMARYSYTVEDWKRGASGENFKALMRFEVERTRELFYQGAALPSRVHRELSLELKLVWFGGMAVLKAVERGSYDVYRRRPVLSGFNKLMVLARGLFRNDLSNFGREKKPWLLE